MNKTAIINGALLTITLGVMGWVGHKAAENAEQLAGMRSSVEAVKEATTRADNSQGEALLRMERKLDEMVPRREFEAKLLLVEAEQRKSDIKLREIDVEILRLKTGNR
ncbi:MAG TPA: hypothetical protein VMZ27_18240 [Candidatus Saccharimonadales bacterium]|nr:hypothetical protein [Candidatus Saccharimonadales bacterium]